MIFLLTAIVCVSSLTLLIKAQYVKSVESHTYLFVWILGFCVHAKCKQQQKSKLNISVLD
jgi:hypothetical protein